MVDLIVDQKSEVANGEKWKNGTNKRKSVDLFWFCPSRAHYWYEEYNKTETLTQNGTRILFKIVLKKILYQ